MPSKTQATKGEEPKGEVTAAPKVADKEADAVPTTPTATTPKAPEKKMVMVDQTQLDSMMGMIKRLEQDNKSLMYAADKNRIQRFQDQQPGLKEKSVRLTINGDRIATSWRTVRDEVSINPATGKYIEDQEYEILYDDHSKETIKGYPAFSDWRYRNKTIAKVVSETLERDGSRTFKVGLADGRELSISEKFVN